MRLIHAVTFTVLSVYASDPTTVSSLTADTKQSLEPLLLAHLTQCPERPAFFNASAAIDDCRHPVPHTCSFYPDCVQAKLHCRNDEYPLGYGLKYCSLFQQRLHEFTPAGRAWVLRTMTCLQHALVPVVPALVAGIPDDAECGHPWHWIMACERLGKIAFASHPACYIDSGICELKNLHDYFLLLKIVGLKNVLSTQALQTGITCLRRWL